MEQWLKDDAGKLLAMRGQIEQTVRNLRERALPATAEEIAHDRSSHARIDEWQKQAARLASVERAQAIRTKAQVLTLPLPTAEEQALTSSQLNDLARSLVDFDESKRTWGEEARALTASGEAGTMALAERRAYKFADDSQGFLHDTLSELLVKLASLDGKERKAVDERLGWARRIETLTLGHPNARVMWQQARESIAKADEMVASKLYRGQTIELRPRDVMGLVPIGMNPATKLWEFYELRSAWDGTSDPASIPIPRHVTRDDDAGYIEVGDDTGIVFVLLPGGAFTMGAQKRDLGPNYDPDAFDEEWPVHSVTLAPFFMARHELTQGQWKRLSGGEVPSNFKAGSTRNGLTFTWANPVEQVSWEACEQWLSRHGLALPTEEQWEYGCRAGSDTPWTCSFAELKDHANLADTIETERTSWKGEKWVPYRSAPDPA